MTGRGPPTRAQDKRCAHLRRTTRACSRFPNCFDSSSTLKIPDSCHTHPTTPCHLSKPEFKPYVGASTALSSQGAQIQARTRPRRLSFLLGFGRPPTTPRPPFLLSTLRGLGDGFGVRLALWVVGLDPRIVIRSARHPFPSPTSRAPCSCSSRSLSVSRALDSFSSR